MDQNAQIIAKLHQVNAALTRGNIEYQDLCSQLQRKLNYAQQDVESLKGTLAKEQWQWQQERLQYQQHIQMISGSKCLSGQQAFFGAATVNPLQPLNQNGSLFESSLAGTLHSPMKGRAPLNDVGNDNKPLKLSDLTRNPFGPATANDAAPLSLKALPKRKTKKDVVHSSPAKQNPKRAPVYSPPAKQTQQKKSANGPTPKKIAAAKKESSVTLQELRSFDWAEPTTKTTVAEYRPLVAAIHRLTNGNVGIIRAAMEWLVENIPACKTLLKVQKEGSDSEARNITNNIESWLQHNIVGHKKKGGTLPMELEHALQAIASAVLFNPSGPMNVWEVLRVLPSIGGRKRLTRTKELNQQMLKDQRRYFSIERKIRKDAMWPLVVQFVRRSICWNDKFTKVDTNYSRKIKCKEPIIEEMEGGGFRLLGWKVVEREMRMWYEETKLSDVHKLILNSPEWKELKEEYPAVSLSKSSLRLALCPSVRKPSFRSCVNEKMSALNYLLEDFHRVINTNETLQQRINECACARHSTARYMRGLNSKPPLLWNEELRCKPSRFCGIATCQKVEEPHLKIGDKEPPKLRPKQCTKSECPNCGFNKKMGLGDPECKAFADCEERMEATLWQLAARNGDRTQREPVRYAGADSKTVAEVYKILVDEVAPAALEHLGEAQWYHAQMERRVATFKRNEIIVLTDFSATPELVAKEVGNCHEAEHCVIDILVVLDNSRVLTVVQEDGTAIRKRINDCTYWAFLGSTDGKGKKNDHRFHREALKSVVAFHEKKMRDKGVRVDTVDVHTDNCGGQFKNQYVMGDVAWFAEAFPGIRLEHSFAPVFEFKGVHDGFGKIIKWKFKEAELKGIRIPSALAGYTYLLQHYCGRRTEWDDYEAENSTKLLQKGPFIMTEARVGYVLDTKEEVDSVKQSVGGDHILHCDRECVPRTVGDRAAVGLSDVYSIRGKRKPVRSNGIKQFWELELAARVCFCTVCSERDTVAEECPYKMLRQVRQILVSDKAKDDDWCLDQRAKRAAEQYFRKNFKETTYLNMKRMRDELRRINRPFPEAASRTELCHIFLSMHNETCTTTNEQEELLLAVEEQTLNPDVPSVDDDRPDDDERQELPCSGEDAPSSIDQLAIGDVYEEDTEKECVVSDGELALLTDFATFSNAILHSLLAQRGLPTTGSRAEQEDRLELAVRPF